MIGSSEGFSRPQRQNSQEFYSSFTFGSYLPGPGWCPALSRREVIYTRADGARGAVAQLGEHLVCNQEVAGSIPVRSICPYHPRVKCLARPGAR
jgi:hypothetical protein